MNTPPTDRDQKINIISTLSKKISLQEFASYDGLKPSYPLGGYRAADLKQKTNTELDEILANFEEFKEYYEIEFEKARFFNKPDCHANFEYYAKCPDWSIDEGIAIVLEKDPSKVTWDSIQDHKNSPFYEKFKLIRNLALRHVKAGTLSKENTPGVFLAWAQRMRLDIPPALVVVVEKLNIRIADFQSLYELAIELNQQKIQMITLREAENNLLKEENQRLTKDKEISPSSENTYLAIIGVLLNTCLSKDKAGNNLSCFVNQAAIIDYLINNFKIKGISKSTLEDKFAKAKQFLKEKTPAGVS